MVLINGSSNMCRKICMDAEWSKPTQTHPFALCFAALRPPAPYLVLFRGSTRKKDKRLEGESTCFFLFCFPFLLASPQQWFFPLMAAADSCLFQTLSLIFLSLTYKDQLSPCQRPGFQLYWSIPSNF